MPLTASEKEIAAKLGFDEEVLTLIKEALNPEMGVVSPPGDRKIENREAQPHVFRGEQYPNAPLLEKDLENYRRIQSEYPELSKLVSSEIEFRSAKPKIQPQSYESTMKDKMSKEDFVRFKRFSDFVEKHELEIQQHMEDIKRQQNLPGNAFFRITPPNYSSDETVDACIAALKEAIKDVVISADYKPKAILGLRFKCGGHGRFGPDDRLDILQSKLEPLGYKLSENHSPVCESRMFETREEAVRYLASYGIIEFDSLSLREQRPQKYDGIYPVDLTKDTQNQNDLRTLALQTNTFLSKEDTKALDEIGQSFKTSCSQPDIQMMGMTRDMRIEPGTKIKKTGDRRWLLDRPARYEAKATIKLATLMKMPKGDFGIELVKTQNTNGLNHGIDNRRVVDQLNRWNNKYGITVLEATFDSMKVKFKSLPDDLSELLTEVFLFDPEIELSECEMTNAAVMRDMASQVRQTKTISFWWD